MQTVKIARAYFDGRRRHEAGAKVEFEDGVALPSGSKVWDEGSKSWRPATEPAPEAAKDDDDSTEDFKAKLYPGARREFSKADGSKTVSRDEVVAKALAVFEDEGNKVEDWNDDDFLKVTDRRSRIEAAASFLLGEGDPNVRA